MPKLSGQRQSRPQELQIIHFNPTIAVGVETSERSVNSVQNDTRTHEAVERDAWWCPRFGSTSTS